MRWERYMLESARTAPHTGDVKTFLRRLLPWYDRKIRLDNLTHGALGISAEYFELCQTEDGSQEEIEEIGDLLWFVALILRELGDYGFPQKNEIAELSLSGFMNDDDYLQSKLELIVSHIKAHRQYGVHIDSSLLRTECIRVIAFFANYLYRETQSVIGDVLDANIRKLRARFPDKFSTYCANVRDIDAEKEAMNA